MSITPGNTNDRTAAPNRCKKRTGKLYAAWLNTDRIARLIALQLLHNEMYSDLHFEIDTCQLHLLSRTLIVPSHELKLEELLTAIADHSGWKLLSEALAIDRFSIPYGVEIDHQVFTQ